MVNVSLLRRLQAVLPAAFAAQVAWADPSLPTEPQPRVTTYDGIIGLVVNQTITPLGYEFYQAFSLSWSEKPESLRHSLSIVERPSKRYGNQISVLLGQTRVYAGYVPFKRDGIQALSEKAVEETQGNVVAMEMENAAGDPDLAKHEI